LEKVKNLLQAAPYVSKSTIKEIEVFSDFGTPYLGVIMRRKTISAVFRLWYGLLCCTLLQYLPHTREFMTGMLVIFCSYKLMKFFY
jgi:hypothetical protein